MEHSDNKKPPIDERSSSPDPNGLPRSRKTDEYTHSPYNDHGHSPYLNVIETVPGVNSKPFLPPETLDIVDGIRPSSSKTRGVSHLPAIEESLYEDREEVGLGESRSASSIPSSLLPFVPFSLQSVNSKHSASNRVSCKPALTSISEEFIARSSDPIHGGQATQGDDGAQNSDRKRSKSQCNESKHRILQGFGDVAAVKSRDVTHVTVPENLLHPALHPNESLFAKPGLKVRAGGEGIEGYDDKIANVDTSTSDCTDQLRMQLLQLDTSHLWGYFGENSEQVTQDRCNSHPTLSDTTCDGATSNEQEEQDEGSDMVVNDPEPTPSVTLPQDVSYGADGEGHSSQQYYNPGEGAYNEGEGSQPFSGAASIPGEWQGAYLNSGDLGNESMFCRIGEEQVIPMGDIMTTYTTVTTQTCVFKPVCIASLNIYINQIVLGSLCEVIVQLAIKRAFQEIKMKTSNPPKSNPVEEPDGTKKTYASSSTRPKTSGSDSVIADIALSSGDVSTPRESFSEHTTGSASSERQDKDFKDKESKKQRDKEMVSKQRGRERERNKRKRDREERGISPGKQKSLRNAVGDMQRVEDEPGAGEKMTGVIDFGFRDNGKATPRQSVQGTGVKEVSETTSTGNSQPSVRIIDVTKFIEASESSNRNDDAGDVRDNSMKTTCGLESQTVTSQSDDSSMGDNQTSRGRLRTTESSDTQSEDDKIGEEALWSIDANKMSTSRFGKRTAHHRQKQLGGLSTKINISTSPVLSEDTSLIRASHSESEKDASDFNDTSHQDAESAPNSSALQEFETMGPINTADDVTDSTSHDSCLGSSLVNKRQESLNSASFANILVCAVYNESFNHPPKYSAENIQGDWDHSSDSQNTPLLDINVEEGRSGGSLLDLNVSVENTENAVIKDENETFTTVAENPHDTATSLSSDMKKGACGERKRIDLQTPSDVVSDWPVEWDVSADTSEYVTAYNQDMPQNDTSGAVNCFQDRSDVMIKDGTQNEEDPFCDNKLEHLATDHVVALGSLLYNHHMVCDGADAGTVLDVDDIHSCTEREDEIGSILESEHTQCADGLNNLAAESSQHEIEAAGILMEAKPSCDFMEESTEHLSSISVNRNYERKSTISELKEPFDQDVEDASKRGEVGSIEFKISEEINSLHPKDESGDIPQENFCDILCDQTEENLADSPENNIDDFPGDSLCDIQREIRHNGESIPGDNCIDILVDESVDISGSDIRDIHVDKCVDILESQRVNIFEHSCVEITEDNIGGIRDDTREDIPGGNIGNIPDDTREDIPGDNIGNIPDDTREEIPGDNIGNIPDDTREDIPGDNIGNIPDDTREDIPGDTIGNIPDDTREDIPGDNIGNIPDDTREDIPAKNISNILEDTTGEIPGENIFNIPEDTREDISGDNIGGISEVTREDILEDNIGDIPKDTWEEIPGDNIGDIPEDTREDIQAENFGGIPKDTKGCIPGYNIVGIPKDTKKDIPGDNICAFPVNTWEDTPGVIQGDKIVIPDDTKEELPGENIGDIPEDTMEEIPGYKNGGSSEITREDISEDNIGDIPEDNRGDIQAENVGGIHEDTRDDMPGENICDIREDTRDDVPGDIIGDIENTWQDIPGDKISGIPENTWEDMPGENFGDIPEYTREDIPEDNNGDTPDDGKENIPGGYIGDIPEGTKEDSQGDNISDIPEYTREDIPDDNIDDIHEDTLKNIPRYNIGDIPDDTRVDILGDNIGGIPKDTRDDFPGDNICDIHEYAKEDSPGDNNGDIPEDTREDIPEHNIRDIPEDTKENIPGDNIDDIPEDPRENILEDNNGDIPENIFVNLSDHSNADMDNVGIDYDPRDVLEDKIDDVIDYCKDDNMYIVSGENNGAFKKQIQESNDKVQFEVPIPESDHQEECIATIQESDDKEECIVSIQESNEKVTFETPIQENEDKLAVEEPIQKSNGNVTFVVRKQMNDDYMTAQGPTTAIVECDNYNADTAEQLIFIENMTLKVSSFECDINVENYLPLQECDNYVMDQVQIQEGNEVTVEVANEECDENMTTNLPEQKLTDLVAVMSPDDGIGVKPPENEYLSNAKQFHLASLDDLTLSNTNFKLNQQLDSDHSLPNINMSTFRLDVERVEHAEPSVVFGTADDDDYLRVQNFETNCGIMSENKATYTSVLTTDTEIDPNESRVIEGNENVGSNDVSLVKDLTTDGLVLSHLGSLDDGRISDTTAEFTTLSEIKTISASVIDALAPVKSPVLGQQEDIQSTTIGAIESPVLYQHENIKLTFVTEQEVVGTTNLGNKVIEPTANKQTSNKFNVLGEKETIFLCTEALDPVLSQSNFADEKEAIVESTIFNVHEATENDVSNQAEAIEFIFCEPELIESTVLDQQESIESSVLGQQESNEFTVLNQQDALESTVLGQLEYIEFTALCKQNFIESTVLDQQEAIESKDLGLLESIESAVLDYKESFGCPVLGHQESVESTVLDQQESIESCVLDQQEAFESKVLGQLETIESSVLENHEAIECIVLGQQESFEFTVLGQQESIESTVLGQQESIESTVLGQLETIESTVVGQLEAIESTVLGQQDSIESTVLGQIEAIESTVLGQLEAIESTVLCQLESIESSVLYRQEAIESTASCQHESIKIKVLINQEDVELKLGQQKDFETTGLEENMEQKNVSLKEENESLYSLPDNEQDTLEVEDKAIYLDQNDQITKEAASEFHDHFKDIAEETEKVRNVFLQQSTDTDNDNYLYETDILKTQNGDVMSTVDDEMMSKCLEEGDSVENTYNLQKHREGDEYVFTHVDCGLGYSGGATVAHQFKDDHYRFLDEDNGQEKVNIKILNDVSVDVPSIHFEEKHGYVLNDLKSQKDGDEHFYVYSDHTVARDVDCESFVVVSESGHEQIAITDARNEEIVEVLETQVELIQTEDQESIKTIRRLDESSVRNEIDFRLEKHDIESEKDDLIEEGSLHERDQKIPLNNEENDKQNFDSGQVIIHSSDFAGNKIKYNVEKAKIGNEVMYTMPDNANWQFEYSADGREMNPDLHKDSLEEDEMSLTENNDESTENLNLDETVTQNEVKEFYYLKFFPEGHDSAEINYGVLTPTDVTEVCNPSAEAQNYEISTQRDFMNGKHKKYTSVLTTTDEPVVGELKQEAKYNETDLKGDKFKRKYTSTMTTTDQYNDGHYKRSHEGEDYSDDKIDDTFLVQHSASGGNYGRDGDNFQTDFDYLDNSDSIEYQNVSGFPEKCDASVSVFGKDDDTDNTGIVESHNDGVITSVDATVMSINFTDKLGFTQGCQLKKHREGDEYVFTPVDDGSAYSADDITGQLIHGDLEACLQDEIDPKTQNIETVSDAENEIRRDHGTLPQGHDLSFDLKKQHDGGSDYAFTSSDNESREPEFPAFIVVSQSDHEQTGVTQISEPHTENSKVLDSTIVGLHNDSRDDESTLPSQENDMEDLDLKTRGQKSQNDPEKLLEQMDVKETPWVEIEDVAVEKVNIQFDSRRGVRVTHLLEKRKEGDEYIFTFTNENEEDDVQEKINPITTQQVSESSSTEEINYATSKDMKNLENNFLLFNNVDGRSPYSILETNLVNNDTEDEGIQSGHRKERTVDFTSAEPHYSADDLVKHGEKELHMSLNYFSDVANTSCLDNSEDVYESVKRIETPNILTDERHCFENDMESGEYVLISADGSITGQQVQHDNQQNLDEMCGREKHIVQLAGIEVSESESVPREEIHDEHKDKVLILNIESNMEHTEHIDAIHAATEGIAATGTEHYDDDNFPINETALSNEKDNDIFAYNLADNEPWGFEVRDHDQEIQADHFAFSSSPMSSLPRELKKDSEKEDNDKIVISLSDADCKHASNDVFEVYLSDGINSEIIEGNFIGLDANAWKTNAGEESLISTDSVESMVYGHEADMEDTYPQNETELTLIKSGKSEDREKHDGNVVMSQVENVSSVPIDQTDGKLTEKNYVVNSRETTQLPKECLADNWTAVPDASVQQLETLREDTLAKINYLESQVVQIASLIDHIEAHENNQAASPVGHKEKHEVIHVSSSMETWEAIQIDHIDQLETKEEIKTSSPVCQTEIQGDTQISFSMTPIESQRDNRLISSDNDYIEIETQGDLETSDSIVQIKSHGETQLSAQIDQKETQGDTQISFSIGEITEEHLRMSTHIFQVESQAETLTSSPIGKIGEQTKCNNTSVTNDPKEIIEGLLMSALLTNEDTEIQVDTSYVKNDATYNVQCCSDYEQKENTTDTDNDTNSEANAFSVDFIREAESERLGANNVFKLSSSLSGPNMQQRFFNADETQRLVQNAANSIPDEDALTRDSFKSSLNQGLAKQNNIDLAESKNTETDALENEHTSQCDMLAENSDLSSCQDPLSGEGQTELGIQNSSFNEVDSYRPALRKKSDHLVQEEEKPSAAGERDVIEDNERNKCFSLNERTGNLELTVVTDANIDDSKQPPALESQTHIAHEVGNENISENIETLKHESLLNYRQQDLSDESHSIKSDELCPRESNTVNMASIGNEETLSKQEEEDNHLTRDHVISRVETERHYAWKVLSPITYKEINFGCISNMPPDAEKDALKEHQNIGNIGVCNVPEYSLDSSQDLSHSLSLVKIEVTEASILSAQEEIHIPRIGGKWDDPSIHKDGMERSEVEASVLTMTQPVSNMDRLGEAISHFPVSPQCRQIASDMGDGRNVEKDDEMGAHAEQVFMEELEMSERLNMYPDTVREVKSELSPARYVSDKDEDTIPLVKESKDGRRRVKKGAMAKQSQNLLDICSDSTVMTKVLDRPQIQKTKSADACALLKGEDRSQEEGSEECYNLRTTKSTPVPQSGIRRIKVIDVKEFPKDKPCIYRPYEMNVPKPPAPSASETNLSRPSKPVTFRHRPSEARRTKKTSLWKRLKSILKAPRLMHRDGKFRFVKKFKKAPNSEMSEPSAYMSSTASDSLLDQCQGVSKQRGSRVKIDERFNFRPVTADNGSEWQMESPTKPLQRKKPSKRNEWRQFRRLRILRHSAETMGPILPPMRTQNVSNKNYVRMLSENYQRAQDSKYRHSGEEEVRSKKKRRSKSRSSKRVRSPLLEHPKDDVAAKRCAMVNSATPEVFEVFCHEDEDISTVKEEPTVRMLLPVIKPSGSNTSDPDSTHVTDDLATKCHPCAHLHEMSHLHQDMYKKQSTFWRWRCVVM